MNRKAALLVKLTGPLIILLAVYGIYLLAPFLEYMAIKPLSGDIICRANSGGSEGRFFSAVSGEPVSECGLVLSHHWRWYVLDFNGRVTLKPLAAWIFRSRSFAVFRIAEATSGISPGLRNKFVELAGRPANPPVFCGAETISRFYPVKTGSAVTIDDGLSARLKENGFAVQPGVKVVTPGSIARSATLDEIFSTGMETGRLKRR
ncbi:MAG: hypothetical protein PHW69_06820 [Elusimicrobiaceae bacterium]|nr:hypothetical protein [Elusimicrobiaceae bacterium]